MIRCILVSCEILFCYLLQSSVFPYFELAGVVPDMLLILVVSTAFFCGQNAGLVTGFFAGLLMDFCMGDIVGLFAAFYMIIGFLNGYAVKIFDREDYLLPLGMIAVSEFVYSLFYYAFQIMLRGKFNFGYYLLHVTLPRIVYTAFVSVFFYKLFLWLHLLVLRLKNKE